MSTLVALKSPTIREESVKETSKEKHKELRLTWHGHDICPSQLITSPESRLYSRPRLLKKPEQLFDGDKKAFAMSDLIGLGLGLQIAVEGGDQCAVDVVRLETRESAGICNSR